MKTDFSFGIIPIHRTEDGLRLLLIQHTEGHWAFPKGHAEGDEKPVKSAKREFTEETGISDFVVDEKTVFEEHYEVMKDGEKIPKTVTYFPAMVANPKVLPQESEIKNFGWFSFEEAQRRVTFDVTKRLLLEITPYLAKVG